MIKKAIMALILMSFIGGNSQAATTTEEMTEEQILFEEVVTGVTRRQEKTFTAAANVTVIPGKFLERYAIRNMNDLFEVLEGGWHTWKGSDEVLVLRGVSGYANDKILFLYDGMLFPTFLGLGENNWPNTFDDVEKIEIIKGPNTSVWGGQGTQGTINIIHKGAEQFT
ncbi:MAG: TonB-dependent receptor plug domain-containing protein, partial [bacterium]|nr:TonB-dependent receptor plug domain-containing protein [bacterium]